jgi:uncharacterized repeat protein (TIGR01451 family)
VETTGPRSIAVGKESTYSVTMINDGQDSASDIFAQVLLPASIEVVRTAATVGEVTAQPAGPQHRLKWDVPQMTAHSQERLEITVRPRTNAAFELAVDWAFQPLRSTASVEVQQPELKVTMAGVTEMRYGEQTLYVITVSNPGTGAADNVTIDLGLGERIESMELGSLAAGEKKELEFPLIAAAAGEIRIAAVARADAGLRSEATSQITIRRAMLQLEVSAPKLKYAGAQASFQIAIRNTGDAPAENLAATIKLPAQAEYLSGLPGATAERGQLDWNVGTLSPGTQRVFNILCTLNQPGQNRLEAAVTDTTGLTANHVAVTEVQALADLKLVVNDPKGPIPVGEPVVYEVEVINRGSKAAQTIKILGQFSAGIDPVHIEGAEGEISSDGQVLFDSITHLEAGQSIKLLITAKASADGNHRFRAQVTCNNPETNLVAEDTTRFVGEATVRAVGNSARLAPSAEPTPAPRQFEIRR